MKRRIGAIAITALVSAGVWIAKANHDGVCLLKGRHLTDRERLEAAFDRAAQRGHGRFPVKPGTDDVMSVNRNTMQWDYSPEWHEAVGYDSFDEYIALYPNCCSIKWLGEKKAPGWPEPTLWQRISGNFGFGVEFESWDRYRRPDGSVYRKHTVIHPYFTNCGYKSPKYLHDG